MWATGGHVHGGVEVTRAAHIAVLTDQYLYRGTIDLKGQRRVSDTLNDRMTDVIRLREATLYRYEQLDEPAATWSMLYLRKCRAHVVMILQEEASQFAAVAARHMEKARAPGSLFVAQFWVQGIVVFSGKVHAAGDVLREGELFIPIQKAVVKVATGEDADVHLPATVALVNNETLISYQYDDEIAVT